MESQTETSHTPRLPEDVKRHNAACYDLIAERYNKWTAKHHHLRLSNLAALRIKVPQLASRDAPIKILDLGCGGGSPVLETILSQNFEAKVVANDLSSKQMDIAKKNLAPFTPRVHFMLADMMSLEFPPDSFDAVIAMYSLIHIPIGEQAEMIRKIHGWLRPGGCLLANFEDEPDSGSAWDIWLSEGIYVWEMGPGADGTMGVIGDEGFEVEKAEVEGDEEKEFLWVIAKKV